MSGVYEHQVCGTDVSQGDNGFTDKFLEGLRIGNLNAATRVNCRHPTELSLLFLTMKGTPREIVREEQAACDTRSIVFKGGYPIGVSLEDRQWLCCRDRDQRHVGSEEYQFSSHRRLGPDQGHA